MRGQSRFAKSFSFQKGQKLQTQLNSQKSSQLNREWLVSLFYHLQPLHYDMTKPQIGVTYINNFEPVICRRRIGSGHNMKPQGQSSRFGKCGLRAMQVTQKAVFEDSRTQSLEDEGTAKNKGRKRHTRAHVVNVLEFFNFLF